MIPVIFNLILAGLKFAGGKLSGSVSVTADALNNFSDALTALITALGLKAASLIGGRKHENGHGRIEWLVALVVSCSVVLVGWELLRNSISAIRNPAETTFHYFTLIALIVSIGVKIFLYFYNKKKSKEKNSQALKAAAADCISDAVSSGAVMIALIIDTIFSINLDGWCGLLVSLFIMYNGIKSFGDTAKRIMGEGGNEGTVSKLRKFVLDFDSSIYRDVPGIQIIDYGYERCGAILSVVPAYGISTETALQGAASLKTAIYKEFHYEATIQVENPVEESDYIRISYEFRQAVKKLPYNVSAENIRVNNEGDRIQILSRIYIRFGNNKKEDEILEAVQKLFPEDKYDIVVKLMMGNSEWEGNSRHFDDKDNVSIKNSTYYFLEDDCIELFGLDKGYSIYEKTEKKYQELIKTADYYNNSEIEIHLKKKLYPLMSFYKTLLAENYSIDDALKYASHESEKVALAKKEKNEHIGKMRFAYRLYRMGVKSHIKKHFPAEGWNVQWISNNKKEIEFDMKSCIYYDLSVKNGCPELCPVYCANDIISFSGLMPKIRFERSGTLATECDRCDFHFINNKAD